MMLENLPKVRLGLVAVSRDCFPASLSERRRHALAEAYARLGVRAFSLPARELLEVKEYLMGVTL